MGEGGLIKDGNISPGEYAFRFLQSLPWIGGVPDEDSAGVFRVLGSGDLVKEISPEEADMPRSLPAGSRGNNDGISLAG